LGQTINERKRGRPGHHLQNSVSPVDGVPEEDSFLGGGGLSGKREEPKPPGRGKRGIQSKGEITSGRYLKSGEERSEKKTPPQTLKKEGQGA